MMNQSCLMRHTGRAMPARMYRVCSDSSSERFIRTTARMFPGSVHQSADRMALKLVHQTVWFPMMTGMNSHHQEDDDSGSLVHNMSSPWYYQCCRILRITRLLLALSSDPKLPAALAPNASRAALSVPAAPCLPCAAAKAPLAEIRSLQ